MGVWLMAMFNRDNEQHIRHLSRHSGTLDRAEKARDPLAHYWGKGIQTLREQFNLTLEFQRKPEDSISLRKDVQ
jgi:hypothetical protein